ncbi:hypothetical protein [Nitrosomonas sp.]|uniref:hypothetical protein n=1 Tax=Nitrosomonas sp. TaxID=42353 RepID=UPI0025DFC00F|nr:hypothetical protein [Nitrosomonas sp.]
MRNKMIILAIFAVVVAVSTIGGIATVHAKSGPVIQSTCHGAGVSGALKTSQSYADSAAGRVNKLDAMSKAERAKAWNQGPEARWFGKYSNSRFKNVRNRVNKIASHLKDWKLDVRCNWKKTYYGSASPGIKRITLGKSWKDEVKAGERVQTFPHEAAHIAGAVLGGEVRNKYGVINAIKRAKNHPGVAVRTAENLGYYVICRKGGFSKTCN